MARRTQLDASGGAVTPGPLKCPLDTGSGELLRGSGPVTSWLLLEKQKMFTALTSGDARPDTVIVGAPTLVSYGWAYMAAPGPRGPVIFVQVPMSPDADVVVAPAPATTAAM